MNTYSFKDVTGSFSHTNPLVGSYSLDGSGVGDITVSMASERTAHDISADGNVMVSKIKAHNGSISIQCQQTSDLNSFLQAWFNFVDDAATIEWAAAQLLLRCVGTGKSHICSGISPQKEPDQTYQKQGQMVTWVLMAADVRTMNA